MKTDELITMLASGLEPMPRHAVARRFAVAVLAGAAVTAVMMASVLHVRADLGAALALSAFWIKLGFVAAVAVCGGVLVARLSVPGRKAGWMTGVMALPFVVIWLLTAWVLMRSAPDARLALVLGDTWKVCPVLIAMLSVPIFVGLMWALRGLAPTRPRLAGGVAGLFAGAVAAMIYCLHCPEMAAPFIGLWYVLGMLLPAGAGALLGGRLLRW